MSLYRRGKVWWMDFHFHGQRIQETTEMTSITRAREVEANRKQGLKDGATGIKKPQQPLLFATAAEEYIALAKGKKRKWAPRMLEIQKNSVAHLLPDFGNKLLQTIEAKHIAVYQEQRTKDGASGRTVNMEVGALRAILRRHKQWERLQDDVVMLDERDDAGRALTAEEESALLLECGRSRSRMLLPFVVLALETGARFNTVRTLQWRNIDFANRCLKFGKDKTRAGTGRTVPLNQRAVAVLTFWAQQFPNRKPEHYVFPLEKCSQAGAKDSFGFTGNVVFDTDPTQPIGDVKEAWEGAKKRTRRHCPQCRTGILADKQKPETGYACIDYKAELKELPAGLTSVRFHDLRHTAVSRMIAARIPLPIIAKIVGWTAGTMAKMAARYGHFGIEELRGAVEAISSNGPEASVFGVESLQFSLHSAANSGSLRAN
jgi:integrase